MCPLRLVLIFLSATLAGFFVLRGLKSQPEDHREDLELSPKETVPLSAKVRAAICTGFWTCVDMASGRYMWRAFISPTSAPEKKQS
uniref:Uncharacterized protein LOC105052272 n=1 Tax=Elaeis guineensis var. tenera TaxID=51953 RepID=A0A6I9RSD4_ELAGV|nr:uncharacterized protein LOC105052272 [Elaeis guineensis]